MKKHYLLLLLAFVVFTGANAQTFKATGTVIDSTGAPLPMANVIAYQKDKNLGGFGFTNNDGKYQILGLKKDSTYVVKVSFLGYKTLEDKITNLQSDIVKNYVLKAGDNMLDGVSLSYQIPITIKGDTITYDTDSFTNGTERKLGEVLEKLPGVEVNEDGDVQVEGKAVTKVLVDGKEFFEGDTRLATKNLPAGAVGKVEVLKNYNNQGQLRGLGNDSDNVVINIKLKEGKKKFWFGDVTVAGGDGGEDSRYLFRPKAFYYSPDVSFNLLTDINNLGESSFTFQDYARFTGQRRGNTRASGSSIAVANNSNALGNFTTNRATNIDSKFGATSATWKVNPKLDFSAYAIASSSTTEFFSRSQRSFIDGGLDENTAETTVQDNTVGLLKIGANYNPSTKLAFDYDGSLNLSDYKQSGLLISERTERGVFVSENIDTRDEQSPVAFDQSLNIYYTAGENNIFALESRALVQQEDPFYNAIRDVQPFPGPGGLDLSPQERYDINQNNLIDSQDYNIKLDYWRVLNKKSNINFTIGSEQVIQDFNSNIFQILDNGVRNDQIAERLNNDVRFNFEDYFAAAHFKAIVGKFTFTPGVTYHKFKTTDEQNGVTNTIDINALLPDVNIVYQLRSSESFTFDFGQTVNFSDVNNYAQGIVFNNYSQLRSGNNQIEGAFTDRVSLRYNNYNLFNYTTIFGNISYTKQRDAIQSNVTLDGINRISTPINAILPNETVNGFLSYGKEFGKIQARINTNHSYSIFNNIINDNRLSSKNYNQTYGLNFESRYKEGFNADLGYTIALSSNDNGATTNKFTTQTVSANANYRIGKIWEFSADYDYNLFTGTGDTSNTFQLLEAAAFYKSKSTKWELKLAVKNLLNTRSVFNNNFNQIFNSTNETFILPRYVYFQVQYRI